jgi:hypothetical protein
MRVWPELEASGVTVDHGVHVAPHKIGTDEIMFERYQPDLNAYGGRLRTGPYFVCAILARDKAFPDHHIIYEGEETIVFLAMNPTRYGYTLVATRIGQRMERPLVDLAHR